MFRSLVYRILPNSIRSLWKQLANCKTLSVRYGQYQSIKQSACLDQGRAPIPWYTYPAIEFLSNLDFSDKVVFEYGCGNSTLWWGRLAGKVLSVEDSAEWYEQVAGKLDQRNTLFLEIEKDLYVGKISNQKILYDVIVIDGKYRHNCSQLAGEFLQKNGIIILDNSDWHCESARIIREKYDLIQVDFHGFGPINKYTWTTSIFFSRAFDMKPIGCQPRVSIGGLHQNA